MKLEQRCFLGVRALDNLSACYKPSQTKRYRTGGETPLMPDWAVVFVMAVMAFLVFLVARALLRR